MNKWPRDWWGLTYAWLYEFDGLVRMWDQARWEYHNIPSVYW